MVKKSKKIAMKWQYLGETDPAQFIHSNKTHRTVSEAFRDADYATAIQRPKSEWEDCVEFMGGFFFFVVPMLSVVVYMCYLILKGN
jgi:hypothetical protein